VVLYPPRNTTPNVTLSAFPARVPAPRSRIQNPNVNPFVLGHYAEARTRKSMIRAPFRELHGPHKEPIASPLHTAYPSATNLSARRLVVNLEPFGLLMRTAGARFCCTGATVTGGRTGVLLKSSDTFWALTFRCAGMPARNYRGEGILRRMRSALAYRTEPST
jgi:hypothetical protein